MESPLPSLLLIDCDACSPTALLCSPMNLDSCEKSRNVWATAITKQVLEDQVLCCQITNLLLVERCLVVAAAAT